MNKKRLLMLIAMILVVGLTFAFAACGDKNDAGDKSLKDFTGITFENVELVYDGEEHVITCKGVPDGANVRYENNKGVDVGTYNATATISKDGYKTKTLSATLKIILDAGIVVEAKNKALENATQNYDFKISLAGNVSIAGISGTAHAYYDGQYRYDGVNDNLLFKRVTSGALLYDSIEYIYSKDSAKIKVIANEDNVVKRTSVCQPDEQKLNLLNIPFIELVEHTQKNNISDIEEISGDNFKYKANLALASDNKYLQFLFDIIGKIGAQIEIKDVSLTNPAEGIDFYFNMNQNNSMLTGFKFEVEIAFPVKGVQTTLTLSYEQKNNNSTIEIPSVEGIIADTNEIIPEMNAINDKLTALKNSESYSLDLKARNELDPGWNASATVDEYIARMYKNTNKGRVDFNHSYEYKAHTEEDGAETFKYTLGNLENGDVYLISRKGDNIATVQTGITVDRQFDYLINAAKLSYDQIDCIKKTTNDTTTIYNIYMNKESTLQIQNRILDIINSNDADGVLDVDNKFNAENFNIKDASVVVEETDGKIVSIKVETKISYCPTSGEYVGQTITLTDSILLMINANADKAIEYKASESADTPVVGLISSGKYIL